MRLRRLLIALLLAAGPAHAAQGASQGAGAANPADAALCDAAAARAAAAEGAPLDLLRAISLAETGGGLGGAGRPWPWTTNVEGVGAWHPTREAAIAHIRRRHAEGARSYDIGCFQVNRLWHGDAFASLEDMFDPNANARYAARFLRALHDEAGGWERAAGWYHSRTPGLAEKYRTRVSRILAGLPKAPVPAAMLFGDPDAAPPPDDPLTPTAGAVALAAARLAPPQGEAGPDRRAALGMLRRALPLFAAIAAAARPGASGGAGALMPLERDAPGPLISAGRPLFDTAAAPPRRD